MQGKYQRDDNGKLIEDPRGVPFRQWRLPLDPRLNPSRDAWKGIEKPDDIWHEIVEAAQVPGTTSAPRLQPIAARLVMLQSGMRAPMGIKVKGPDLDTIERVALEIESFLKQVSSVEASAVIADRVVGKPYLEIDFKRRQIARYGLTIRDVQDIVEVAIGGRAITTTVEGRERFPRSCSVSARTAQRDRNDEEDPRSGKGWITHSAGASCRHQLRARSAGHQERGHILNRLCAFRHAARRGRGLTSWKIASVPCRRRSDNGEFVLPPGVSYSFAGNYENQLRSQKTLMVALPLALFIIFIILYLQISVGHHYVAGIQRNRHCLVRRIHHALALRPAVVLGFRRLRDEHAGTIPNPPD